MSISFDTATARGDLESAICDWSASEPWRIVFDPVELSREEADASWRVMIELVTEREAVLQVDSPLGDRWQHAVALPAGIDETGVEAIAQAVHSSLEAAALKRERAVDTAPAPLEPSEPDEPPLLRLHSGIGYHFYARGDEPATHGPRLRIELDWHTEAAVLSSFVVASLFGSARERIGGLSLRLRGAALGAGVSGGLASGPWKGRLALGGGAEALALEVRVLEPEALRPADDDSLRPRAFIGSELGLGWSMGPFELEMNALLRWQLSRSHYDIRDGARISSVLTPWRLQPGLALDVAYVW